MLVQWYFVRAIGILTGFFAAVAVLSGLATLFSSQANFTPLWLVLLFLGLLLFLAGVKLERKSVKHLQKDALNEAFVNVIAQTRTKLSNDEERE